MNPTLLEIVSLSNKATFLLDLPSGEYAKTAKDAGDGSHLVIRTTGNLWLFEKSTGKTTGIRLYDDIVLSPKGNIVGLVRSESVDRKRLLNLEGEPGDILVLDSFGKRRTILDGLVGTANLFRR